MYCIALGVFLHCSLTYQPISWLWNAVIDAAAASAAAAAVHQIIWMMNTLEVC